MITLNAFTNGFAYCSSSLRVKAPRRMRWVFYQHRFDGVTLFEDGHMFEYDPATIETRARVGWLVEPRSLRPENYTRAWERRDKFDFILTCDRELLDADPDRFKFMLRGGVTLFRRDWGLHAKSKSVAMIAGSKSVTPGHQLRRRITAGLPHGVDVFGLNEWAYKVETFRPYRFAVVIESERTPDRFTEHLLDVIALGCVPLYWGAPNIGDYLDDRGILAFATLDELAAHLGALAQDGEALYADLRPYLEANLARLDDYEFPEDWMIEHTEVGALAHA